MQLHVFVRVSGPIVYVGLWLTHSGKRTPSNPTSTSRTGIQEDRVKGRWLAKVNPKPYKPLNP